MVEFEDYYRITDDCDDCGKCITACPNFAIAKTIAIGTRLDSRIDPKPTTSRDGGRPGRREDRPMTDFNWMENSKTVFEESLEGRADALQEGDQDEPDQGFDQTGR